MVAPSPQARGAPAPAAPRRAARAGPIRGREAVPGALHLTARFAARRSLHCPPFLRSARASGGSRTQLTTMNRYLIAVAAAASLLRAQTQNPDPQGAIKDLARQAGRLQDELVSAHSQFLKGVKVNGVAMDPKSVMREAIYLTGGKLVEAQVAQFFVVEEVRKQIENGQRKAEDFEVSEADVLKELEP